VLLARFDFGPAITQHLEANYHQAGLYKIGTPLPARLYLRGRAPTTAPSPVPKPRRKPATTTSPASQPSDLPIQVN
jgi:hypothetical protein